MDAQARSHPRRPRRLQGRGLCRGGDGYLHALDAKTGDKLWEFYAGGWIIGGISVNDEVVVAANTSGEVFIINSETGVVRLPYDAITTISGTTALVGDRLYVSTSQGRLSSVNWRERAKPFRRAADVVALPLLDLGPCREPAAPAGIPVAGQPRPQISRQLTGRGGRHHLRDGAQRRIVAIDAEDGDKLWERTVTDFLVFSLPRRGRRHRLLRRRRRQPLRREQAFRRHPVDLPHQRPDTEPGGYCRGYRVRGLRGRDPVRD